MEMLIVLIEGPKRSNTHYKTCRACGKYYI